jgi:hypothetical protein
LEQVDTGSLSAQNAYNFASEKTLMQYDRPKVLSLIYSYDLPFGSGRRYLRAAAKPIRAVVSGWTFSSLHQYESGGLLQVTVPNALGNGVLYSLRTRPNVSGQPFRTDTARTDLDPNKPSSQWISPASFAIPAPFTFGTAANLQRRSQSHGAHENMALLKHTAIRESVTRNIGSRFRIHFNRTEFGNGAGQLRLRISLADRRQPQPACDSDGAQAQFH